MKIKGAFTVIVLYAVIQIRLTYRIECRLAFLIPVNDMTLCALSKSVTVYDCHFNLVLKVTGAQTLPQHVSANQCSATFRLCYRSTNKISSFH